MAKNLLDTLRKNLEPQQSAAPQLGQTEAAGKLLAAKSGKASAGMDSGPRASALGERITGKQVQAASDQMTTDFGIKTAQQDEQMADIEQKEEIQQSQFAEQNRAAGQKLEREVKSIFDDLARTTTRLEAADYRNRLEQSTQLLRLSNEKYIHKLQQAGNKARLEDSLKFKEAAFREVMAAELQFFKDDQKFMAMMNADQRDFEIEMGKMDINAALAVTESNIAAANTQARYEGYGNAVSGAAKVAGAADKGGWFETDDSVKITNTEVGVDAPSSSQGFGTENLA